MGKEVLQTEKKWFKKGSVTLSEGMTNNRMRKTESTHNRLLSSL